MKHKSLFAVAALLCGLMTSVAAQAATITIVDGSTKLAEVSSGGDFIGYLGPNSTSTSLANAVELANSGDKTEVDFINLWTGSSFTKDDASFDKQSSSGFKVGTGDNAVYEFATSSLYFLLKLGNFSALFENTSGGVLDILVDSKIKNGNVWLVKGPDLSHVTSVGNVSAVPGPIAGAGLPALLALGGFVWARRRKAAAVA